jgi:hypothetical protein
LVPVTGDGRLPTRAEERTDEMQLLFEVWREACRHIVIGEFLTRVAPLLRRELAFEAVILRRV